MDKYVERVNWDNRLNRKNIVSEYSMERKKKKKIDGVSRWIKKMK